eukprot:g56342.t1
MAGPHREACDTEIFRDGQTNLVIRMVSIEGTELEATFARYMRLPIKDKVLAEYVWIGNLDAQKGVDLRCKTRTLGLEKVTSLSQLPPWNFDGSSTGQAPGHDSEVYLKPVAFYPDPFRLGNNIIVLCETCLPDGKMTPIPTNKRRQAAEWFQQQPETVPWFGIEQEYTMFYADEITPLGWPRGGYPKPQGINGEVLPGQWEYQIGPCVGIDSGDQMTISRYILLRVAEDFGVVISFDPKPIPGNWNGSGCHTNFSTAAMRADGGFAVIVDAVEKLGKQHHEFMKAYGEGNERRLTGRHETASIEKFSWGVADRGASVRVGRMAKLENKGYFEDRRPASNMDPYVVTGLIYNCCVLEGGVRKARSKATGQRNSEIKSARSIENPETMVFGAVPVSPRHKATTEKDGQVNVYVDRDDRFNGTAKPAEAESMEKPMRQTATKPFTEAKQEAGPPAASPTSASVARTKSKSVTQGICICSSCEKARNGGNSTSMFLWWFSTTKKSKSHKDLTKAADETPSQLQSRSWFKI